MSRVARYWHVADNTAGSPTGSSAYASAKAGVIQLRKTLARKLGPHGITSSTRTPEEVAEHVALRRTTNVLNRLGRLDELANAVLFPASDDVS
jgi:NAD(P)-dependent dehydrogenase (short-subunit alcohol dehydrogenase family)